MTALSTGESSSYDANGSPLTLPSVAGRRMTTQVDGGITIPQTFDADRETSLQERTAWDFDGGTLREDPR